MENRYRRSENSGLNHFDAHARNDLTSSFQSQSILLTD